LHFLNEFQVCHCFVNEVIDEFESRYEGFPFFGIDLKAIFVSVKDELLCTEIDGLVGECFCFLRSIGSRG
jgi:hypothetical protein